MLCWKRYQKLVLCKLGVLAFVLNHLLHFVGEAAADAASDDAADGVHCPRLFMNGQAISGLHIKCHALMPCLWSHNITLLEVASRCFTLEWSNEMNTKHFAKLVEMIDQVSLSRLGPFVLAKHKRPSSQIWIFHFFLPNCFMPTLLIHETITGKWGNMRGGGWLNPTLTNLLEYSM